MYGPTESFLSLKVPIIEVIKFQPIGSQSANVSQHSTGVVQVSWDWFEHAIASFANLVYSAIRFAISSAEAEPLVSHKAFIR